MKQHLTKILGLFLIWLLLGVGVRPAEAHANLIQSIPEANATLERAPVQIELFFSEPIEAGFSTIEVIDLTGKRVDNDDAVVDPADPTHMTVSLRSLTDGIYTVTWRTLSSVDSHITAGAFPIGVGNVDAAAMEAAAQASQQVSVSPGEMASRWVTFVAVMTLVGGALFMLFIWQPALASSGVKPPRPLPWQRIARIAVLGLLFVNIIWLLIQSGQATGVEIAAPWQDAVRQVLFTTRFGAQWIARLMLALLVLGLLPRATEGRWQKILLGVTILLPFTIAFGSHAAAEKSPALPIIADWIHLTAASVWVGALIHLLVGLYLLREMDKGEKTRLTAVLIPRFSALALASVATLVLTGLYSTLLHIKDFEALTGTIYGRTLIIKLAIFLPMLLLGAVNLLVTTPNMKKAAEEGGQQGLVSRFRKLVTSEVVLGIAVVLSVAVLTTLPPPPTEGDIGLQETQQAEDLSITLEIDPGRVGLNTFVVTLEADGQPVIDAREVSLRFSPALSDLPPTETILNSQDDGTYRVEGGFISLPDAWQIQAAVRRDNTFDVFANFDFSIGTTVTTETFPWYQVISALTVVAGLLYLFVIGPLTKNKHQKLVFGQVPGVILAVIGIIVFIQPPQNDSGLPVNPIPPNADSLAAGEDLYTENCLPCHGVSGGGDGPVGRTLNPPPADLTQHTIPGVHPDGRLYNWISNGVQDSVMPAFDGRLSDEERWHIVNYIRTLATE